MHGLACGVRRSRFLVVVGALALATLATLGASPGPPGPASPPPYVEVVEQVRARTSGPVAAAARADDVLVGATIRIVGTVATRSKPRRLVLQERRDGAWQLVGRRLSTRAGAYTFRVPAGDEPRVRTFRVRAPRAPALPAGVTRPIRVVVVAGPLAPEPPAGPGTEDHDAAEPLPVGYVGAGSPGSWSFLFSGGGRWDPCTVVRWAYNPTGQGYAALADVRRAFAKISGASGLRFKHTGSTSWRYLGDVDDRAFPAKADIVVGWADAAELPGLAGGVVGVGGGRGVGIRGADVRWRLDRGYLTLDRDEVLTPGFDSRGWGQVVLHEVLHALGLGHADQRVQVMYGTATADNLRFGAGDLTGMAKIGEPAGCLS